MRVALLDYDLPEACIATHPPAERDGARLLVVGPSGPVDRTVRDLPDLLPAGALVVVNDTKVLPARLLGRRVPSGGKAELLLLERLGPGDAGAERWSALGRASKPLRPATELRFGDPAAPELVARVVGRGAEGGVLEVELASTEARGSVLAALDRVGAVPLPPYVRRPADAADRERYQTLFAAEPGAVAAPTAGLHLSEAVLAGFAARGIELARVTLHVGLGTFRPVEVDDLDEHPMHEEVYAVPVATAAAIAAARARAAPVVAIGTTVVRALESAADPALPGAVRAQAGRTRLLIQPGYAFRVVDRLFTNFHLPRSTLLALVAAFAGLEPVRAAYEHAKSTGYRFFSYGDAMLLARALPSTGDPADVASETP